MVLCRSCCVVRSCVVRGGELEAVGGDVRVMACWLEVLFCVLSCVV